MVLGLSDRAEQMKILRGICSRLCGTGKYKSLEIELIPRKEEDRVVVIGIFQLRDSREGLAMRGGKSRQPLEREFIKRLLIHHAKRTRKD